MLVGFVVSLFEVRQDPRESTAGDQVAGNSASRERKTREASGFEKGSKTLP